MAGVAWVFVGAAAVATLVALLVFLVPLGRGGAGSSGAPGTGQSGLDGPAGSLTRGFSYLHVAPPTGVRRAGVHERFARAFARIDAVDPHEAPRRIGEALLEAGVADAPRSAGPAPAASAPAGPVPPATAPTPAAPSRPRPGSGPVEHPREPA